MVHRIVGAALVALVVAAMAPATAAGPRVQWISGDGYDWWTDCSEVPDQLAFLPTFLGGESPGFVDLRRTITRDEVRWRVMQYTRDKDFGPTRIGASRWYGGMGADDWPLGSANAARFLDGFRVTAFDIDGNRHAVDPSCVVVLSTDERTIGFYNAWVRFSEPGLHTLKIIGRQIEDFFFIHPSWEAGLSDPLGLDGRRVFLAGESMGDALDEEFVHAYELHVGKD